jgi:hypothetical protein
MMDEKPQSFKERETLRYTDDFSGFARRALVEGVDKLPSNIRTLLEELRNTSTSRG